MQSGKAERSARSCALHKDSLRRCLPTYFLCALSGRRLCSSLTVSITECFLFSSFELALFLTFQIAENRFYENFSPEAVNNRITGILRKMLIISAVVLKPIRRKKQTANFTWPN